MLNLMVAADYVRTMIDRTCDDFGITPAQYNVLRILRGVYPEGYARGDIAARLIERAPDVTRLVDRLEAQGFVARDRSEEDRRLSLTRITARGLKLLDEMEPSVVDRHRHFSERVSRRDCRELTRICEGLYDED